VPLPFTYYRAEFSRFTSNVLRSAENIWAPRVQPFKVTQGQWNRHGSIGYATSDFLLVIHSSYGSITLSGTVSEIYSIFGRKLPKVVLRNARMIMMPLIGGVWF